MKVGDLEKDLFRWKKERGTPEKSGIIVETTKRKKCWIDPLAVDVGENLVTMKTE